MRHIISAENESLSKKDEDDNGLWQQMVLFQDGRRNENACKMLGKVRIKKTPFQAPF